MIRVRTSSVDDTRAVAAAVAGLIRLGDIVLLGGEMGAGKTAFTQGLGLALGVTARITSPTFTIVHEHVGDGIALHHLDVYRLEHLHEVLDLGLAELIDEGAVVVIEWGDAVTAALPPEYLEVRLAFGPHGPDQRDLSFTTVGLRWGARLDALHGVLSPWEAPC